MLPSISAALTGVASEPGLQLAGVAGKAIASAVDPAARAYRQQLKKDISDMQRGKLGLSEAEKRTMLAGTQRALQAQTAGTEAMLRRSAAAQGGQIGAEQRETLAQQAGKIDDLSQQQAQQRFANIMRRIEDKRAEARQMGADIAGGALGATALGALAYPEKLAQWKSKRLTESEDKVKLKKMQEVDEYRKALEATAPTTTK